MLRRRWTEITLRIPLSHQDLITGQLAMAGFTGFLQNDDVLSAYLPRSRWTQSTEQRLQTTLNQFQKEFRQLDITYSKRTVREQNWNARWERSVGIVEATTRIIIKPSWKKLRVQDRGKIVLHIDPKMSFGTGHHETTRLCLALLERYLQKGMNVLDVGSGTGVLSIAAVKLGARKALAVDSDPWACRNAKENMKRNRVKGIRVLESRAADLRKGAFDLILSNIDLPTNLKMLPGFIRMLTPGGVLVLSGMLSCDLTALLNALKGRKIAPMELLEENEWVAAALAKTDAR